MRLALSTAAAPELLPDALDEACRARGLDGVELVLGEGDDPDARHPGVRIVALRAERIDLQSAPRLARASARFRVPLSVPAFAVPRGALHELAQIFAQAKARLLLAHATALEEVLALLPHVVSEPSLGLAWEVRPSTEDLSDRGAILVAAREYLGLVRLHGGGPEQREQDGRGLGALFHELALSEYAEPIVMQPSRSERLPLWSKWLRSQKSSGCGHAYDTGPIELDVRDVEPKDRLETILGAYKALSAGATMTLTVDHDPSCMYHMLNATEPEGSFSFRKTEDGPEVWRAEVTRR